MAFMTWLRIAVAMAIAAAGCLATSPEKQEQNAQGRGDEGDPEHRPGQPCLVCHRESFHPGDDVFVIAGTIFLRATDSDKKGLRDADVVITDAQEREIIARTNHAGNFMITVDEGRDMPRQKKNGKLKIGFHPEFPLHVRIRQGADEIEMQSLVWRDGSCAGCHRGPTATASSVEKVYLLESQ